MGALHVQIRVLSMAPMVVPHSGTGMVALSCKPDLDSVQLETITVVRPTIYFTTKTTKSIQSALLMFLSFLCVLEFRYPLNLAVTLRFDPEG